ncbi:MAG: hypothetical protein ACRDKJ_14515, partial [Actinomycetota bacterium]
LITMRRTLVVAAAAFIIALGVQSPAWAPPLNCQVSATTVPQGGSFTVSGTSDTSGEFIRVIMDGTTQIGSGNANVGIPPVNFSIVATVPESTSANQLHTLAVQNLGGMGVGCPTILVIAAPAPTPPTPVPPQSSPQASPVQTPIFVPVPIPVFAPQQQQQQQQQAVPVALPLGGSSGGGGASLPKTGADVAEVGGVGTASLLAGLAFTEFARRRRRHWFAPASTSEARAPTAAGSSVGSSEGELLLPYFPDATR